MGDCRPLLLQSMSLVRPFLQNPNTRGYRLIYHESMHKLYNSGMKIWIWNMNQEFPDHCSILKAKLLATWFLKASSPLQYNVCLESGHSCLIHFLHIYLHKQSSNWLSEHQNPHAWSMWLKFWWVHAKKLLCHFYWSLWQKIPTTEITRTIPL